MAKVAKVSWTVEPRGGGAKRCSKEVPVALVQAFLTKLEARDAFNVSVVWEAAS